MQLVKFVFVLFGVITSGYADVLLLDKKDHSLPEGVVTLSKEEFTTKLDMTVREVDAITEIKLSGREAFQVHREYISETEFIEVLELSETTEKVTVNGNPKPQEVAKEHCLKSVEVRFLKRSGVWAAKGVDGELSDEQGVLVEDTLEALNKVEKSSIYGYEPRKVGEKWEVPANALDLFANEEVISEKVMLHFVELTKVKGVKVAILTVDFDVITLHEQREKQRAEGTLKIYRDLDLLVDVKKKGEFQMSINLDDPKANLRVSSSVLIEESLEIINRGVK